MNTIPQANSDYTAAASMPVNLVMPGPSAPTANPPGVPATQHRRAATDITSVTEIRTLDELRSFRTTWLSLLEQTGGADFFQTPYWLETYFEHFAADQELRILIVYSGEQPVGILPLIIAKYNCSLGQFRVLTYPLDWWGTFYGPIGPDPQGTLRAGLAYIKQQPKDWDFLELRFVQGDALTEEDSLNSETESADATLETLAGEGFKSIVKEPQFHCARISLPNTWEDYLAGRRKSWKTIIRRAENKTKKVGEIEHIRYRPSGDSGQADPRWDLYDECSRLSKLSWQGKSDNTQTFAHPNVDSFLRSLHQQAVAVGCVDMNLLLVDGKAVAYHYGYHWQGYFSSLRLGFDPEFSKQGVGTVLTSRMIQDSIRRGDHTFDFLPDCMKAKLPWQTSVDVGYRYTHFPSSIGRTGLLKLKRWFDREVRKKSIVQT